MQKKISYKLKKPNNLLKKKILKKNNNKIILKKNQVNTYLNKIKKEIINNTYGWTIELLLNGIGYKSFYINKLLILDLGYSNLITYKISKHIKVWNLKTKLFFFSFNEIYLKNLINKIKKLSLPNIYTGKGILYNNEIIKLKSKKIR